MAELFDRPELPERDHFDQLLNKYSIIWIWSIITGLNSGITYSFYNTRFTHFGLLNIVLIAVDAIAFIFALLNWRLLSIILSKCILPIILNINRDEHASEEIKKATYYYTSRVFYFLVYAIAFRFFGIAVELIFNSLIKFD